jgi:hypothetical protein
MGDKTLTLREWADLTGISERILSGRRCAGWPVEDILDPDSGRRRWAAGIAKSARRNAKMLTWQGESMSIHDWARKLGLNRCTIRERLKAGWSVERALGTPTRPWAGNRHTAKLYTHAGRTQSLPAWARELKISTQTLAHRLKKESFESALRRRPRRAKLYRLGTKTKTLAGWSAHLGIGIFALRSRLRRGWTIRRALTEPLRSNRRSTGR